MRGAAYDTAAVQLQLSDDGGASQLSTSAAYDTAAVQLQRFKHLTTVFRPFVRIFLGKTAPLILSIYDKQAITDMDEIYEGDVICMLREKIPDQGVDLSFWSPPYFVGKTYERHMDFDGWKRLIADVIRQHSRILKPGGFMVVNIGDILCFPDPQMPRFQADNIEGKRVAVTRDMILEARRANPGLDRNGLARMLGCSEQTIQRRLENNNVRGGRSQAGTRIMPTSHMVCQWAGDAGMYLYDKRIWHKDPAWMSSKWHSGSYRAVDEYEHILVFWNPGITVYDRSRLTDREWSEWGSRGVWEIPSVRRNRRHEAEFPEELAGRVIRLFSPKNGVVLDPFVGTGTTTCMARRNGRHWMGIDSNPEYVRIARGRTRAAR